MALKRDKLDIVSQILETCLEGSSKTNIVYRVNLNFKTVNPYLEVLVKNKLIEYRVNPNKIYKTADKGKRLLKDLGNINDILNCKR